MPRLLHRQSEVGTCRERTDGQWHGEIDTIMWSMAGVLPFHASRCIRKRKAFAQSTPGSNSRGCLGSSSPVQPRLKPSGTTIRPSASLHTAVRSATAPCSCISCAPLLSCSVAAEYVFLSASPHARLSLGLGGAAQATGRAVTDKTLNPVNCACTRVSRAPILARSLSLLLRVTRSCL